MALYGWMMFLSVLSAVKKIQKDFDFDLIDAHYVYPDGFAAVLLGRVFKKPVVVSARGSDINLYSKFPLIRLLLRYTLRKADRVISVCSALKEVMIELGIPPAKITIVPNGVDVKKFYRISKAAARKDLGISEDRKVIVSVGNLIPRKGYDLLIRAIKILIARFGLDNPCVAIVGEGPSKRELEKLISALGLNDQVRLVGAVPHKDLHRWYSAADVSCLTSSREGWPNVLLESVACGTPVVAAKTWGVPEVITSDQIGLLAERTEEAIADAVLRGLRKKWSIERLLEYARKHTWEETAKGVLRVFQTVLNNQDMFLGNLSAGNFVETRNINGAK
jgi:glycosyltransferase involved in cell wall biosynthesis